MNGINLAALKTVKASAVIPGQRVLWEGELLKVDRVECSNSMVTIAIELRRGAYVHMMRPQNDTVQVEAGTPK